mmetsp:Transcript_27230/g.40320  ORF Transcript_27230/g.40320 Transcript_27230/m.40320 type:complete len:301 (-) Transcript_27230:214-1116(-)
MGLFSRSGKGAADLDEYDPYDNGSSREVEENHSLDTDRAGATSTQFRTIFRLNIAAAIFQAASAGAIFGMIDNDVTYPFYTNYPLIVDGTDGKPAFGPDSKVAFELNIGWLTGVFLGLSALDHLLVCTCFKGVYERGLSKNFNIFRWVEYALSASLMRVLVGILSGVTDLHMQFLQFGLTAVTMLFGLAFELENKKNRLTEHNKVKWYLYWFGFIPHFFSWAVVIGYFFYALSKSDPPGFVYAIIFIIFTLDLMFAVILGLQWLGKGCFRPYINGEIAFIILSFTSKNLLAWINFFGAQR